MGQGHDGRGHIPPGHLRWVDVARSGETAVRALDENHAANRSACSVGMGACLTA
jgi:hypothetical protein